MKIPPSRIFKAHSAPRPTLVLALLLLLLIGACALGAAGRPSAGGRSRKPPPSGAQPPATGVTLVWTGEQNGHLEPCGCAKPQLGGMLRRAGYLQAMPAGPSLRVDNGDLTEARGRQDELKAETSIQLLNQLGYSAINLGEADLRLGLPYLQSLAGSFKGALLCANARDAADRPLFQEYLLRDYRVGQRDIKVAVVGLLSERYAPEVEVLNPGLKLAPASDTLDRLRPALERQDFVLLLFHGEPDEARQLVAGQGWISAVIVAHAPDDRAGELPEAGNGGHSTAAGGQATDSRGTAGPKEAGTHFLMVGRDGKYLGLAQVTPAAAAGGRATLQKVRGVPLGPEVSGDAAAHSIETVYLRRVTEEGLLEKLPRLPIPDGDHFAGTAACASCHPAAHRTWLGSRHSYAWATLVHVGHQRDPDCVGCHVVGLEYQGGFQNAALTPRLENVGCESCHHAAGRHAASPATIRPPKVGEAACANCHVLDHSPGFDFTRFWAKIRH
jgi:hypothetical protein